ncbi:MAG: stage V sporulation protein AA [Lachnospiraceae bacterium]|nr:stage V sporulation protein AA [Lachnospiraceae bacterium]
MGASDTLYLKIDKNVRISGGAAAVRLGEIAQICCADKPTENKVKTLRLPTERVHGPGRYIYSLMDVLPVIWQEYPKIAVNNLGETDFILTVEKPSAGKGGLERIWSSFKTVLICFLSFFGAAFSIMAFHMDVGMTDLFARLYELLTGASSGGAMLLEISYSIGVGLGILLFFHHFARRKNQADPTPLQVQMRVYENDVDTTVIEADERKHTQEKKEERG